MRSIRILSAMLTIICMAAGAAAQETPKIEPVMTHIPAGSMGYAAVHSIDGSIERVTAWLADTGLGRHIMNDDEEGGLLEKLLGRFPMGKGFNTSGGAAIVMLDAKKFDIDLPAMIAKEAKAGGGMPPFEKTVIEVDDEDSETQPDEESETRPNEDSATQPATTQADEDVKLPYVIFLAGSSVEETFDSEKIKITQDGKYQKLAFTDGDEFLAGTIGSYVILSPRADALDAVIASRKNALEELGVDKGNLVMAGGIVCHINMTLSAPVINAGIEAMKDNDGSDTMFSFLPFLLPFKAMVEMSPFYTYAFSQMETFTFTGKADDMGLLANILVDWKPDSLFAKIYAANSGETGELLDKVPNFGYFFAIGATLERGKEAEEITLKRVDALLANKHISPHLSKEMKDRADKLALDIHKQVDKWQLVTGGTNGNGMMSVGVVMHCQDSEKTKELLAQSTSLIEEIVDSVRTNKDPSSTAADGGNDAETAPETAAETAPEEGTGDDPNKIKFIYTEAAETCGELEVDTIDIKHTSMDQFADMPQSPLTIYLGENKLCIRIASPDSNTVVMTFGGGKEMMAEALKAVEAKKPLLTEEQAAELFKYLPQNCSTMVLVNPGNIFTATMTMTMGRGSDMPIPDFTHLTPIAFGSASIGKLKHGVIYVPNELIREFISSIEAMQNMGKHGGPPMREGEDF